MDVDFALGVVKELIFPPVRWVLILYALGTILAIRQFVFLSRAIHPEEARKENSSDWEEI